MEVDLVRMRIASAFRTLLGFAALALVRAIANPGRLCVELRSRRMLTF